MQYVVEMVRYHNRLILTNAYAFVVGLPLVLLFLVPMLSHFYQRHALAAPSWTQTLLAVSHYLIVEVQPLKMGLLVLGAVILFTVKEFTVRDLHLRFALNALVAFTLGVAALAILVAALLPLLPALGRLLHLG